MAPSGVMTPSLREYASTAMPAATDSGSARSRRESSSFFCASAESAPLTASSIARRSIGPAAASYTRAADTLERPKMWRSAASFVSSASSTFMSLRQSGSVSLASSAAVVSSDKPRRSAAAARRAASSAESAAAVPTSGWRSSRASRE
eukprot:scaffold170030_cov28-Tisochrysis_lutea.AAC.3